MCFCRNDLKTTKIHSVQIRTMSTCSAFLSGLPCFAGTADGHCVRVSQVEQDLLACKDAFGLLPPQSR